MKLFAGNKGKKSEKYIIYLVEDNTIYSRQLEFFIKSSFGEKVEIICFPVSELAEDKINEGGVPNLLIMDHFLNAKYEDADDGFNSIRRLKNRFPSIHFILHSSMENRALSISILEEGICTYIAKGDDGFKKIEEEIKVLIDEDL